MTKVDPGVMERGFLVAPDSLPTCQACFLSEVRRIVYFKGSVRSKQRFHVSIGQDTLLARITCLQRVTSTTKTKLGEAEVEEFEYAEELASEGTFFFIVHFAFIDNIRERDFLIIADYRILLAWSVLF